MLPWFPRESPKAKIPDTKDKGPAPGLADHRPTTLILALFCPRPCVSHWLFLQDPPKAPTPDANTKDKSPEYKPDTHKQEGKDKKYTAPEDKTRDYYKPDDYDQPKPPPEHKTHDEYTPDDKQGDSDYKPNDYKSPEHKTGYEYPEDNTADPDYYKQHGYERHEHKGDEYYKSTGMFTLDTVSESGSVGVAGVGGGGLEVGGSRRWESRALQATLQADMG